MTAHPHAEARVQRSIAAPPADVFAAWVDPTVPGAFGNVHDKLIVDLKVDGLWYWLTPEATPHYGRFIEIAAPRRLQHSWMSPYTLGLESIVTVSFDESESGTLMTIVHSGLPDDMAQPHIDGWEGILAEFSGGFGAPDRQRAAAPS